jgi:hypothetical protein
MHYTYIFQARFRNSSKAIQLFGKEEGGRRKESSCFCTENGFRDSIPGVFTVIKE